MFYVVILCYDDDVMEFNKLLIYFDMMKRAEIAGGLRKNLTASSCLYDHIIDLDPLMNSLAIMNLVWRVKKAYDDLKNIPF